MKKSAKVWQASAKYWGGNGFHVESMFIYQDTGKNFEQFYFDGN